MEEEKRDKKSFKDRFRENWQRTDESCPQCGSITKPAKGLTKQNINRLFFKFPSFSEWLTLFIIIMVIFMAWAYARDLETAKNFVKDIDKICLERQQILNNPINDRNLIWYASKNENITNATDATLKIPDLLVNDT